MEFNLALEHMVSAFVNKVKKKKGFFLTFVEAEILFYKSKQEVDYSLELFARPNWNAVINICRKDRGSIDGGGREEL